MNAKKIMLMTSAIALAADALTSYPLGEKTFSGGQKCPNCGKPTMTGTVCNLRCAVALKQKQKDGVKP